MASPRRAAVSSFGIGGTNAHVILEEAAPTDAAGSDPPRKAAGLRVLPLSAADPQALRTLSARYADTLGDSTVPFAEVCATAAHRTSPPAASLGAGCGVSGQRAGPADRVEPRPDGGDIVCRQAHPAERPRIAFLYTGSGSQYLGMGRQLMASQPVFRAALEDCDASCARC